ncbi:MAG: hypothetical protein KA436_11405 [Oligoflexales bacterium]|nr:hypothetical protein [Oligoflexales bacterium]
MNFRTCTRLLWFFVLLAIPQMSRADSYSDKSYVQHSFYWQAGWTAVFSSSLALNGLMATSHKSSPQQKFDARLSLLTSGSGLLSVLFNPLPVAYASENEWTENPTLLHLTKMEVRRRQSFRHITFMFTEQVLAALAIGMYDKRPVDALRRLGIGSITSLAFAFSTPSENAPLANLQLRYDGLAFHADFLWRY